MTWKSLCDKVVNPLDERKNLYDHDKIERENVPDEEYDVLDNISINMEISLAIKDVRAVLVEQTEDITSIAERKNLKKMSKW